MCGVSWDYEIAEDAKKDLRDIGPSAARNIKNFLEKRIKGCADPRATGKSLRGNLREYWRYRVKDYRIICHIQDKRLVVLVIHAGHRSSVYD